MSKADDKAIKDATEAAIASARSVVANGDINQRAMIGSLSDTEWGWIVAAAVFGWIKSKAQYAINEGLSTEAAIRQTGRSPEAWEAGAVQAALPALGGIELDWSKPVGDWSRDEVTQFAWHCYREIDGALARQADNTPNIVRYNTDAVGRELSAANGGPLMTPDEMDAEIPF